MRGILAMAICIAFSACAFAGEGELRYVNKIPVYVVDVDTGEFVGAKCTCGDGCDCHLTGICPNDCPAKFKRPEPGYSSGGDLHEDMLGTSLRSHYFDPTTFLNARAVRINGREIHTRQPHEEIRLKPGDTVTVYTTYGARSWVHKERPGVSSHQASSKSNSRGAVCNSASGSCSGSSARSTPRRRLLRWRN